MTSYTGLSQSYNYSLKIEEVKTSEQVEKCLETLSGHFSVVPKYNSSVTRFEFVSTELMDQQVVTEKLLHDGYTVIQFKMKSNQPLSAPKK